MSDRMHRHQGFSAGASRTNPTFFVNEDGSFRADATAYIGGAVTFSGTITTDDSVLIFNDAGADVDFRFEGDNEESLLVLDGGTDTAAIGGAVTASVQMTIEDDTQSTSREILRLFRANPTTIADNDAMQVGFAFYDDGTAATVVAQVEALITDVTDGTEDGEVRINVMQAGTRRNLIDAGFVAAGTGNIIFNQDARDVDVRFEANSSSNHFVLDAGAYSGQGAISCGVTARTDTYFAVNQPALTATADSNFYRFMIAASSTVTIPAGTAGLVTSLFVAEPDITATGTVTESAAVAISAAATEGTRNYALFVDAGQSRFDDSIIITSGTNLTEPSGMTAGLFIEQATNDDSAIMLSSTDVAHGFTAIVPTNTYFDIRKSHDNSGGVQMTALADAGTTSVFVLRAVGTTTANTTKSTAGRGTIELYGTLGSSTDVTNMTDDGNVVVIRTRRGGADEAIHIFDEDGDSHQDVGTLWTNFDTYDDLALLNSMSAELTAPGDPLKGQFKEWIGTHRDVLENSKIVTFNEDGHHFVNWSRTHMLEIGAIRQLGAGLQSLRQELSAIKQSLIAGRSN